jgi:hypothetical protein
MATGEAVTHVPVNLNSGRAGTFHKSYALLFLEKKPPDGAVITPVLSSAL